MRLLDDASDTGALLWPHHRSTNITDTTTQLWHFSFPHKPLQMIKSLTVRAEYLQHTQVVQPAVKEEEKGPL